MTSKTLLRALGLLFAFTLVAAACGSDDVDDAVDDATDAAEDAADDAADAAEDAADDVADAAEDAADAAEDAVDGDEDMAEEALSGNLIGAGASSQEAVQTAWRAGYVDVQPDVQVDYASVGSGAGREQFLAGATNFAGSDAFLDEEELEAATDDAVCGPAGAIEFPVYVSPIALPFNLPGIDSLNLPADVIAGIFAETITSWDDPAIADANPDVELPALAINPVHRADDSGTTENFTSYLDVVASDVWTYGEIETWPSDLTGEAAPQTSGVIAAVTAGEGSITYADASQAGSLATAAVGVGENFVPYSPEAAAAILDASSTVEGRGQYDLAIEVDRGTDADGVYPIVLVSYAIACAEYADENTVALVQSYLGYVTSADGQALAAEQAGSAPISDTLRGQITEALDSITVRS